MIKKILIPVVIILILGAALSFFYFSVKTKVTQKENNYSVAKPKDADVVKQDMEKMQSAYNAQFPDVVDGVINIVSDKKTTIKTESGVEYLISPARPRQFFSDSGIKNIELVEVRGKILKGNLLSLGSIIPKPK